MKFSLSFLYTKSDSFEGRLKKLEAYTGRLQLTPSRRQLIDTVVASVTEKKLRFWASETLRRTMDTDVTAFKALLWATRYSDEHGSMLSIVRSYTHGHPCKLCGKSLTSTNACIHCKVHRPEEWRELYVSVAIANGAKTNIQRFGVANVFAATSVKKKLRKIYLRRYGVTNPAKSPLVKQKMRETNQLRYGGVAPACSREVLGKMQATCVEKYGVVNPVHAAGVKNKMAKTSLKRYGVTNPAMSALVQDKMLATNWFRYGAPSANCTKKTQAKRRQTCREKYGVDHHLKDPEIQKKLLRARYKILKVKVHNKVFECQGTYEAALIPKLVSRFGMANVQTQFSSGFPKDARLRTSFTPDFYIKSRDRFIEMKSTYTLMDAYGMLQLNREKAEYAGSDVIWIVKHGIRFITLPLLWYTFSEDKLRKLFI